MDDKFLYENRPALRNEFRKSLNAKLIKTEESEYKMFNKHLVSYSLIGVVFALILVFTISAPVRANVLSWIQQIAGINVEESTESPLAGVTEVPSMITVLTPIPVSELKDEPFDFAMPQYLPGFELNQDFTVAQSKTWVLLSWTRGQNDKLNMLVEINDGKLVVPAGKGSSSEIDLNGQTALLIRGGWTSDSQWNENKGLELQWLNDGLRYDLQYYKTGDRNEIVPFDETEVESRLDELIQIAESVK
jgi:hypothetical protein